VGEDLTYDRKIRAVELEQVEGVEEGVRLVAAAAPVVEPGQAAVIAAHRLAVDQAGTHLEVHRLDDQRKSRARWSTLAFKSTLAFNEVRRVAWPLGQLSCIRLPCPDDRVLVRDPARCSRHSDCQPQWGRALLGFAWLRS
jgi:hypothetical protein